MSLIDRFSNRALCVGLSPEAIACVVRKGNRLVTEDAYHQSIANPEGAWGSVLSLFQQYLQRPDRAGRRLPASIRLSSRWCRMMMIPWSDALLRRSSAVAFLQSQYVALYGDEAKGWIITADDAPYGQPRLTCAIERGLMEAIQRLANEHKFPCQSVEPILTTAWRAIADSPARDVKAFAVVEAGWISMASIVRGRITGIQSKAFHDSWKVELERMWQRWVLKSPELSDIAHVGILNMTGHAISDELPSPFVIVSLPSYGLDLAYSAVSCTKVQ